MVPNTEVRTLINPTFLISSTTFPITRVHRIKSIEYGMGVAVPA